MMCAAITRGSRATTSTATCASWLLHQGEDIVPIPGTKRRTYLRDNVSAAEVRLMPEELAELAREIPGGAAGDRYPRQAMTMLDR